MERVVELPTGEVTFLFTDIVGSTRRWERDPASMRAALDLHARITRNAVEAHDGSLVKDTGDGFMAVFAAPRDALSAAVDLQHGLRDAPWPGDPIEVRTGIHGGHAEPIEGDYHAPAVNRCARVMAAAHGGQILVSEDTHRALDADPDLELRDLGEHRLKDLDRAIRLFQLVHEGLEDRFPPLVSLAHTPNNLPHVPTPLLGRDEEIADVRDLLRRHRLVTLTGAGGIGKTRLAIQVAAEDLEVYSDGAWLVELGPVSEPGLVPTAVASALRVPDGPGKPVSETLMAHLRDRELLLLLDNCEHLIEPVATLVEQVVLHCPAVTVLATTREPFGLDGEHVHTVPALATDPGSAGVALFLDRARAAGSPPPRGDALATVATICRRLDGLPLAIELAAARTRILSPADIASRLDERFSLLTGGKRTALPRQRTLEATVAWSYDLLDPPARTLLRRLSVFASPFDLADAEEVCATDAIDQAAVLELVAELADRSLLNVNPAGTSRYRMLETIRAYARERLLESDDDVTELRRRHVSWASNQALVAAGHLDGPDQMVWLERVEDRIDDHRAAMRWASSTGQEALGATIAASLYRYWYLRGVREGREWLDRFAAAVESFPDELAARVLFTRGSLLQSMGEYEPSMRALEHAVSIYESIDNPRGLGYALHYLMRSSWGLRPRDEVRAMMTRALTIFEDVSDPVGVGLSLLFIAVDEFEVGDLDAGMAVIGECDTVMRSVGAPHLIGHSVEIAAWGHTRKGDVGGAAEAFHEAVELYVKVGNRQCSAHCLENVALLLGEHEPHDAAVLLAATERLRDEIGVPVPPYENMSFEAAHERVRQRLSPAQREAAWNEGRTLTADEALGRALSAVAALR